MQVTTVPQTEPFSLSVSLFPTMEKFHTTSGAVSKRGEGMIVCVWREGDVMCQWFNLHWKQ